MYDTYQIFGLNISSAVKLPVQPNLQANSDFASDVVIEYGDTPVELVNPRARGLHYQAAPGEFLLSVNNVARYYVQGGNRITIAPEAGASDDDVTVFLIGSVMAALLHQQNFLVLHASAIEVNGKSYIFAGSSGVGKSTLAAGFHKRGYSIIADDICAVNIKDGQPMVVPGLARLKLWSDVLKKLDIDITKLKLVRNEKELEKYYFPTEKESFSPVPIKSIFILDTNKNNLFETIPIAGAEKTDCLIGNTYRFKFLNGLDGKVDHFHKCASVAGKASIHKIFRPSIGFSLNELMNLLEAKFSE
ncbi:MAG: hypothetical protein HQM10_26260 [Candidatus Riflebacteria bacterium]|nr:hypothetical protein [Candidatus Riflebacteria bacterium]